MVIYQIRNSMNGKVYIGQTISPINKRWSEHQSALQRGCHYNAHLQRAWMTYGSGSFALSVIDRAETLDELNAKEVHHIAIQNAFDPEHGYNKATGGKNYTRSQEACQAMSNGSKGQKAWNKGKKMSLEYRNKCRQRTLGTRQSDETKRKRADAMKGRGEWNVGRKHTDEHKQKIGDANRGRKIDKGPLSDEHKAKISAALTGRTYTPKGPLSDEHKARISAALKGKPKQKRRTNHG